MTHRTPPGSDVDRDSTDELESLDPPMEWFTQVGPVVFSIRKALFTMNRARGDTTENTPILCQEALDFGVLRPERSYDTTIPLHFVSDDDVADVFHLSGLWSDSHREARDVVLSRYYPDLDAGQWGDLPQGSDQMMDFFVSLVGRCGSGPTILRMFYELEYPRDPWMFYGTPKCIWLSRKLSPS